MFRLLHIITVKLREFYVCGYVLHKNNCNWWERSPNYNNSNNFCNVNTNGNANNNNASNSNGVAPDLVSLYHATGQNINLILLR